MEYLEVNKIGWDRRAEKHYLSEFYDVEGFKKGRSSLRCIELEELANVRGKKILHLQCHFGLDSLSLARMGGVVTGVDFSSKAIEMAKLLSSETETPAHFVCSDVFDLPNVLRGKFDIVYTSYGALEWLPDMNRWGEIVSHFLASNGYLYVVEFHPFYYSVQENAPYFCRGQPERIKEQSYTEQSGELEEFLVWNHSIGTVVNAIVGNGMRLSYLKEFDFSPYNCFDNLVEKESGKFVLESEPQMPMVYSILAEKQA